MFSCTWTNILSALVTSFEDLDDDDNTQSALEGFQYFFLFF